MSTFTIIILIALFAGSTIVVGGLILRAPLRDDLDDVVPPLAKPRSDRKSRLKPHLRRTPPASGFVGDSDQGLTSDTYVNLPRESLSGLSSKSW